MFNIWLRGRQRWPTSEYNRVLQFLCADSLSPIQKRYSAMIISSKYSVVLGLVLFLDIKMLALL